MSYIVHKHESQGRKLKEDLVELSKVKYGIFNVDEWKRIIETIITNKINEFNFDELPEAEIRKKINTLLYKVTGDVKTSFKSEKGFIPKAVANITGIFEKLEDDVPKITETIMDFMRQPENRESIRLFALNKLDDLTDKTFSDMDYTLYDEVLEKHGCRERDVVIEELNAEIDNLSHKARPYKIALFILALLAAVVLIFGKKIIQHEFLVLTLIGACFLVTGLTLPMIEIDARISKMTFSLLGEPIEFNDQILYYKNKSILEVVQVMIAEDRADLLIVGFLVLLFSVIFPISKMISSIFYVYSKKLRESKVIKFIIFRTGKWSMADVMVLAIFMAFIGFSGILREQLQQIEVDSNNLDLLTTNASHLQVGFYAFMSFAVLGLLLSHKLQYAFVSDKKRELETMINIEEKKDVEIVKPKTSPKKKK